MSVKLVMPSSHLILCRPLLLLPPIPPSIRVFSRESTLCTRWSKYWSFSFSISPSNEHPELISFRMDWLDLLVVQRTLKSLLQHHSPKASILQRSAFFTVYPSKLSLRYHAYSRKPSLNSVRLNTFLCALHILCTFWTYSCERTEICLLHRLQWKLKGTNHLISTFETHIIWHSKSA